MYTKAAADRSPAHERRAGPSPERSPGEDAEIELWNLHESASLEASSQRIVNILGRVGRSVEELRYSLNGGPSKPVLFRTGSRAPKRLEREGDFNIDTVQREDLREQNVIVLHARLRSGDETVRRVAFSRSPIAEELPFRLELSRAAHAEEVAQVVDGRWCIGRGKTGEPCLAIREEDAGFDRIVLFGTDRLRRGFVVRSRLCVTRYLSSLSSLGLLFHWNPHRQGDGTCLPEEWSTGLAYHAAGKSSMCLRVGANVRVNGRGEKLGDRLLGQATLSPAKHLMERALRSVLGVNNRCPQLAVGQPYLFELAVGSERLSLTVWQEGRRRPRPQVTAEASGSLLPSGAAGIIAHRSAAEIYEFEIAPAET